MSEHRTGPDLSGPVPAGPFDLSRISAGLPAATLLDALFAAAGRSAVRAVIEAPPGTGKTTVVPPALANLDSGRVIVTQPRRIAARSAAARLAELSGTEVGELAGYTVRGERKVSAATRVEFVTTGVLVRRLLNDPELTGVGTVILDEVHERAIDSDLAFALVQELGQLLDDLSIVVMSATLDASMWAELLGGQVLSVAAESFDLAEVWAPAPVRPVGVRGVESGFLAHIADTVCAQVPEAAGDVLVFLPGRREIDVVAGRVRAGLTAQGFELPVLELTGGTPLKEQRAIVNPVSSGTAGGWPGGPGESGRVGNEPARASRIILATNVAESALTVPGVRMVIDAGLERVSRLDTVRGMGGLVTVGASKAAMVQRAGRAHREAPGTVVRCMTQADFAARPAHTAPEILTSDLTDTVLSLAAWGSPRGTGLALPTPLPERATVLAENRLRGLGALDAAGHITAFGTRLSTIPADPGIARALIAGAELLGEESIETIAQVVATLAADARFSGGDIAAGVREARSARGNRQWLAEVERFARLARTAVEPGSGLAGAGGVAAGEGASGFAEEDSRAFETVRRTVTSTDLESVTGLVTALAFPERIARRRTSGSEEFVLTGGTAANLPREAGAALRSADWLAVAEVTVSPGASAGALVRAAVPISEEFAFCAARDLLTESTHADFIDGKVRARTVRSLGAIELSSTPVTATAEVATEAVRHELASRGPNAVFGADEEFDRLRARLTLLHQVLGDPWPDVSDSGLAERFEEWLAPEVRAVAAGRKIDAAAAMRRLLPWPEAARFDELAPDRLQVPSGSQIKVQYPAEGEPVLAVKLQECFGWRTTPRIVDEKVPVTLHLLSPAGRPLAVTQDLESFWNNAYSQVRAENRSRYAKHPWPEDPWNAQATAKTNRHLKR